MKSYTCVLSIAGSDSSAGAGIQADLKTFSALTCYGLTVITALTAQNTQGVQAILSVPVDFVKAQLTSVFADIKIAAVKIGMLHNEEIIQMIVEYFKAYRLPLVLDPVMVAKGGSVLLEDAAIACLRSELLPLSMLLTPNIPEAEILLNQSIKTFSDMATAAKTLCAMGPTAVLIKGGHLEHELAKDCLYIKARDEVCWFESVRIKTQNTHGTGCTLSSAITAFLAKGCSLEKAVFEAKQYLFAALEAGSLLRLGHGHGPVQHFDNVYTQRGSKCEVNGYL